MLNVTDHRRDSAGMKYVYPVVSRRAGGVSIGINLNVNNACNWACVYCQVPNLTRGGPPPMDIRVLTAELRSFLSDAVFGNYLQMNAPPEARKLADIAFSGNGEPTSAPEFPEAVESVIGVIREFPMPDSFCVRLITNGSLMHRSGVRQGIEQLGAIGGEVWFKLDRASTDGMRQINGTESTPEKVIHALELCAERATTWVQTCYVALDGKEADESEQQAYLAALKSVSSKIKGVHLYGMARPSMQAAAPRLSNVPHDRLIAFADRIASTGLQVIINP